MGSSPRSRTPHRTSSFSRQRTNTRTINRQRPRAIASRWDRYAAYDGNGRIEYELFNGATKGMKFAYDDLGRVIADTIQAVTITSCGEQIEFGGFLCSPTAWGDVIETNAYVYDSVGNRKDSGGQYGTGNRITAFGSCTAFAHDDNGNMTSRTCGGVTTTYAWRKDNKLASVTSGGTMYSLRYDALGRLTRLDQGGTALRYFLWQGDNLLAELNGSGTAVQLEYSFYPGLDNLHAVKKDSLYMAHKDPRGNVIALTNADSKSVGRSYTYTSWGELHTGSDAAGFNDVDRARWKGALWFDEIGLYYMRARWYDPSVGRFISEDPIGLEGGINGYAFAGSDPVNRMDPSGLSCQLVEEKFQAISGGKVIDEWWQVVGVTCGGGGALGPTGGMPGDPGDFGGLGGGGGVGGAGRTNSGSLIPQCSGGFSAEQCRAFEAVVADLLRHETPVCQTLGSNAQSRMAAGRYFFVGVPGSEDPRHNFEGWALDRGRVLLGEIDPAQGRIAITASGMALLHATVVHEEYHYYAPSAPHGHISYPAPGSVRWAQAACSVTVG